MAHVITRACVKDSTCVPVCPVGAIKPAPGDLDYDTAEMLYIDPVLCIDCGACLRACPVAAIRRDEDRRPDTGSYVTLNGSFFLGMLSVPPVEETPWNE